MPCKPIFLIVSGIDGSGKTTMIEGVKAVLEARGLTCHYSWMRYTHVFVKPLHALARLVRLTRSYQTPAGRVSRHEFYRFPPLSILYAPLTYVDTWLGRRRLDRRIAASAPDVVICDRWANDILIDMAVDFRNSSLQQGRWADRIRAMMPEGAVQVVILRKRAAIIRARPESAHDPDFDLRLSLYEGLPDHMVRITNDKEIEEAVEAVCRMLKPALEDMLVSCPQNEMQPCR